MSRFFSKLFKQPPNGAGQTVDQAPGAASDSSKAADHSYENDYNEAFSSESVFSYPKLLSLDVLELVENKFRCAILELCVN